MGSSPVLRSCAWEAGRVAEPDTQTCLGLPLRYHPLRLEQCCGALQAPQLLHGWPDWAGSAWLEHRRHARTLADHQENRAKMGNARKLSTLCFSNNSSGPRNLKHAGAYQTTDVYRLFKASRVVPFCVDVAFLPV
eukprot:2920731-Amphidinium_carterae.1